MNAKEFYSAKGKKAAELVAKRAGTTERYLYQISLGHRRPSLDLAKRLVEASNGEIDLVSLLTYERAA